MDMSQENAVVQQMQATVTAYMRAECPFHEARSAINVRLQDFVDAIAEDVRDDYGDIAPQGSNDEESRRRRLVYKEMIIGAERQAQIDGRTLSIPEIEKLLGLMCWMCDTAEDLGRYPTLPAKAEAA
jgi:hypothetical protein